MIDLARTRRQLERLPDLARKAHARPAANDTQDSPAPGPRGRLGPRLPSGVGHVLTAIADAEDRDREQPDQLARISQCVRVVLEELDFAAPDPGPEGTQTWAGECGWLLATIAEWGADEWCAEWIAGEVDDVEHVLVDRIHATTGRCAICDTGLEVHVVGPVASAICPACDRVASMRLVQPVQPTRAVRRQTMALARAILGLDDRSA